MRNNALNAIEFLLDNGVDDVRLNGQKEGAVHLGVIYNQLKALDVRFICSAHLISRKSHRVLRV